MMTMVASTGILLASDGHEFRSDYSQGIIGRYDNDAIVARRAHDVT